MALGTAQRQRYHINLQALHAECETNYLRLLKILPDFNTEDSRHLALQAGTGQERRFQFFIFERARYTTTLEIAEFGLRPQWGLSASFSVRRIMMHAWQRCWPFNASGMLTRLINILMPACTSQMKKHNGILCWVSG
jgi:hypothetical protein